jgi:hypothetical protein
LAPSQPPALKTGPLKLAVADAFLLIAGYYVLQDLSWRSAYAVSRGFTPTSAYSLLTRMFSLTGQGSGLQSPPTLDWVQVVVALLIIANVSYVWDWYRSSRTSVKPQV